jgi:hypothetical protein
LLVLSSLRDFLQDFVEGPALKRWVKLFRRAAAGVESLQADAPITI